MSVAFPVKFLGGWLGTKRSFHDIKFLKNSRLTDNYERLEYRISLYLNLDSCGSNIDMYQFNVGQIHCISLQRGL